DRFLASVGVDREPSAVDAVHGIVAVPWPTTELRAPVVGEGLFDLRLRVHHERPVLRDRFVERPRLEHQYLGMSCGPERYVVSGIDDDTGLTGDALTVDIEIAALEHIQDPRHVIRCRRRNRPGRTGLQHDVPDRET